MSISGAYNIGYYATPTPRGRENTTRLYNSSFNIAYGTPIIPIKCKGGGGTTICTDIRYSMNHTHTSCHKYDPRCLSHQTINVGLELI